MTRVDLVNGGLSYEWRVAMCAGCPYNVAMIRVTTSLRASLRRELLCWFDAHQREMPWRGSRDPYAIWVSEIMLQQTRVTAVMPYFQRWMKRFPTVGALARARQGSVLKLWEGLGYYSRARNLHKAARLVCEEFGGVVPGDMDGLRLLPGVGRYTAGAIASIAFGLVEPVLDGNVIRVLCRLFRIDTPPRQAATLEELWSLAGKLLCEQRPGDFNQAMMELGAMVCLPKTPSCASCPLGSHCRARKAGVQASLPIKAAKKPIPHHTIVAGVIRAKRGGGEKILIDRRPEAGLLGGLWEFPGGKVEPGETLPDALAREIREEVGLAVTVGEEICVVEHAYSHFRITLHAFACELANPRSRPRAIACDEVKWVAPAALKNYAFPKANHKILETLQ